MARVLETIASPDDVKKLPKRKLAPLAAELRTFIIDAVSRTGGHLGSNLGAVELTLALHRTFDSPRDRLVFDTGHMAYAHKLLTGRQEGFGRLRQAGGVAGYPSRDESVHDLVENSHASTSLSWAFGLAASGNVEGHVVAVIGDGALTGGMAYEALNNIGHAQTPVVIVLNDNGRSYDHTVSRLSMAASRVRWSRRYRKLKGAGSDLLEPVPAIKRFFRAMLGGVKQFTSDVPAVQSFVEALGIEYMGPIDGHDVRALEYWMRQARDAHGPVVVHAITQKGRGYTPAETDPEKCLHDTSPFEIATGSATAVKPRSWTAAFSDALVDIATDNPDVIALTAAMPGSTGLLPLQQRFPDRVLDVGIAEQHLVTAAAGLAHAGRIPVAAIYATFFSRAFDQANLDVGLHGEHVVYCLDRAGITGDDGPSHHGVLDMALALRMPGVAVLAPSTEADLRALLGEAITLDGPVLIRFPKGRAVQAARSGRGLRANHVRHGRDVVILAVGDRVEAALQAADLLAASDPGVDAAVWDVRSVRPLDSDLGSAAASAELVITVENGVVSGGAGAYICDRITEQTGVGRGPAMLRLGVPDRHIAHGKPNAILADLGLDAAGIAAATMKAWQALRQASSAV